MQVEIAGEAFTFTEVDLPAAIRGLRLALGKNQDTMAQLLGCSVAGYQKWEQGTATPSAQWLLRMLQVCPDEGTRNRFRIRAERRREPRKKPLASARASPATSPGHEASRNSAQSAIDSLYASAEAGDEWAGDRLRQFAADLRGAADAFIRRRKPPAG